MAGERGRLRSGIRLRTTVAAAGILAIALAAGALLLQGVLRHELVANTDAALRSRLDDLAPLARQGSLPAVLPDAGDDGTVVQVIGATGAVVARSHSIRAGGRLASVPPAPGRTSIHTVDHPAVGDGTAYRVATRRVPLRGGDGVVVAAASLEPNREAEAAVRRALLAGLPVLLAIVGAVTWVAVGRALKPVEEIRRTVADISMSALDRRVPEPGIRDEIGRLARTMNEMLDRLASATRRQRAFVADASHELRSPLASIQTQLDVALADPAGTDWQALGRRLLDEHRRIQSMVDDLLFLAADDERPRPPAQALVDLDEIILLAVQPVRARGRVTVDISGVEGGRVRGDPVQLARVVANLLDNAERHARATIQVAVAQANGDVRLTVTDDGPGIPPADRERIFERFTRLDEARTRERGGAGLGLAIARDIVTRHGGELAVGDSTAGTRMVLRIPAAG